MSISARQAMAGLVVAAVTLTALVAAVAGVQEGGDTWLFVANAEAMLSGEPVLDRGRGYLGYSAVIALSEALGLGLPGVVGIQIVVAGVAAVALFDLARHLAGEWAGVIAAMLFLGYLDLGRWHLYIFTDSLFVSAVIIAIWAAHRAAERRTPGGFTLAATVIAAAAFVRPNGWLLLPVVGVYWSHRVLARRTVRWVASGIVAGAFVATVAFVPAFQAGVEHEQPGDMLRQGVVIWGVPETYVDMPAASDPRPGLSGLVRYAVEHPVATTELAVRRVGTTLAHVRPYYSLRHNLYIAVVLIPVYAFAAVGIRRLWRTSLTRLMLGMIGVQLALVAATFANYEGRFLLYVLPLIMAFAAAGAAVVLDRLGVEVGVRTSPAAYADAEEPQ